MMKISLSAALVASLVAPAAFAGGPIVVANEAPAIVYIAPVVGDWAGAYVGANVSWGKGSYDVAGELKDEANDSGFPNSLSKPDGSTVALRAGYDWQMGSAVLGLGAEYNAGKYKSGFHGAYKDEAAAEGIDGKFEIKNAGTVFVRAGYAGGNWLAYGLLGYTSADAKVTLDGETGKANLDGVTLGLGGEYKFSGNWSGYAEYAYTDFGTVEKTDGLLKADLQQVKLGVNYRF